MTRRRKRRKRGRYADVWIAGVLTIALLAAAGHWEAGAAATLVSLGAYSAKRYGPALWHARPMTRRKLAASRLLSPRGFPQDVKFAAAVRAGGKCQCPGCGACMAWRPWAHLCGSTLELQADHVKPWSRGGPPTLDNCQILCGPCNRAKGAKTR